MRHQLMLGSTVSFPPNQTGYVAGFFAIRPEAKNFIHDDQCIPAYSAGWFQETSYDVARADAGFALVITENGPLYWRLDRLTVVQDDETIVFDDDAW